MPDFPIARSVDRMILSTASVQSVGNELSAMGLGITTAAWPSANRAIFVPLTVYGTVTVVKMFWENGTTVNANVDVGIYDGDGARLVSSGSTAQSGASAIQEVNITDTVLRPGFYYLAMALSNGTGQIGRWAPTTVIARALGLGQQDSAFALPSTATFAAIGSGYIPGIFATLRSVI